MVALDIQKLVGFDRIYQAECFPEEVDKMFGKSTGEKAKESTWLSDQLTYEDSLTAKYLAQIAAAIQRQRKAKGYTQQELASKLGVSQVMISRWENGDENFTIATLAKISSALGLELQNPLEKQAV